MDNTPSLKSEIANEAKVFVKWMASSLLDGFFLALWVIVQWLVNQATENFELSGVDLTVLSIFQILFAMTTLIPILIYLYVDTRIMILRAQKKIEEEKRRANV